MLFPCQHHTWEVWPGQEKEPLMVLNRFPWVPVVLWQQELAPGICFFLAWGTRASRAGKLLCAWPVPCWAFCWLGQGKSVLSLWLPAGDAALHDPSGWESATQETSSFRGQNCVYSISSTLQNVTFLPFISLPYLTAALLCWSSGSAFPRIQPGLQMPASWHGHSHIRKMSLTSPSTALQYRCILSELANQIEFLSPAQVIRFCC